MSKTSFLDLPTELLHWIFDYLDSQTILDSIRPVCTQLDAKVKTYNKFQLDLSSSGISDLRSIANLIQPKNVISLILSGNDAIESSRVTLFFELFELDQFTRLQSLILVEINDTAMDIFCQWIMVRLLPSKLLSIELRRQTPAETERIINLLSTTIARSGIQNLHLNIYHEKFITDNVSQPIENALRYLIINNCTYHKYHVILSRYVHLKKFLIENCEFGDIYQWTSSSFARRSYPQLTSLTLNLCSRSSNILHQLSIDRVHSFLSFTPSLVSLEIITRRSKVDSICNGHLWQQFIQTTLLLLKKFQFSFTYDSAGDKYNYPLDKIITPFRTSFWLNDKHWIVNCDYILSPSRIVVHTLPLHVSDSDVVIRCNALLPTNCHHLLNGHWLNHPEHHSADQVFKNL
jgi:hypothetical protein